MRSSSGAVLRAAVVLAMALAACATPPAGANPLGPCGDDARAPGGYAELERLLPAALDEAGRKPDRVDSGRSCSDAALTSLKAHGITELHFAGATWDDSASEATLIAILTTPAGQPTLDEAWVEEWYQQGADRGKKTDNIKASRVDMAPAGEVFRLDVLNDLSYQSVVTWQAGGVSHVVIVATDVAPGKEVKVHDEKVLTAVRAATAAPRSPDASLAPGVSPGCGCGGTSAPAS